MALLVHSLFSPKYHCLYLQLLNYVEMRSIVICITYFSNKISKIIHKDHDYVTQYTFYVPLSKLL